MSSASQEAHELISHVPSTYEDRQESRAFHEYLRAREDWQDVLGPKSRRITALLSAEILNLIEAAEKVCETESRKLAQH
jgi:hypothetical protein